jgi:4-hydroxyphenylpyruvate dioxygenase-like putative hemolysin
MVDQRPIEKESYAVTKRKAKAVGINHVALEVDDIDAALAFYGRFLDFELRHRSNTIVSSISAINSSISPEAESNDRIMPVISASRSTIRNWSVKR